MLHVKIVSFTKNGSALGARIAGSVPRLLAEQYNRSEDSSLCGTLLSRFAQQAMYDANALVFIGAAGIAVRAIAPHLRGKTEDPAVIVIDEAGRFIVPLLSGHLGGANALAEKIAEAIGAQIVLTTATDVRCMFAVDTWAKAQGLFVFENEKIRYLSSAILRGECVGLRSDFPIIGDLPDHVTMGDAESGFVISSSIKKQPFHHTLHLVPKIIVAGIGCRRGKTAAEIRAALDAVLKLHQIPKEALCAFATINIKKNEPGLLEAARHYDVPVLDFLAEQLQQAKGDFAKSAFVENTVGVDNVCERAAVLASDGNILCKKTICNGVTIALAEKRREVAF